MAFVAAVAASAAGALSAEEATAAIVPAPAAWHVAAPVVVSGSVPALPTACGEPTSEGETLLAAQPGDSSRLLAVWTARPVDGANTAVTAVSDDGGASWSRSGVPGTGPCSGGPGDWVLDQWVAIGPDGRAYYDGFAGHDANPADVQMLAASATDLGRAWSTAAVLDDSLQGARGAISRTSITADPMHPGRAWAVWSRLLNPASQGIFVARTDDGGATWQPAVKAADAVGGAPAAWQLVVRPGGGLVLAYGEMDAIGMVDGAVLRQDAPALARAVRSDDGGTTWSSPVTAASLPSYVLCRAAAGPDGSVYLVWNELQGSNAVVRVARSVDGGRTWGPGVTAASVPAGPLGARYVAPDVAVTSTGLVGVSFYSGGPGGDEIQRMFAGSADGGVTWTARPLGAPFSFDTGTGGTGDGPQGAYQGLAPAGRGFGALFIVGTGDAADPTDVVFVRITPTRPA